MWLSDPQWASQCQRLLYHLTKPSEFLLGECISVMCHTNRPFWKIFILHPWFQSRTGLSHLLLIPTSSLEKALEKTGSAGYCFHGEHCEVGKPQPKQSVASMKCHQWLPRTSFPLLQHRQVSLAATVWFYLDIAGMWTNPQVLQA